MSTRRWDGERTIESLLSPERAPADDNDAPVLTVPAVLLEYTVLFVELAINFSANLSSGVRAESLLLVFVLVLVDAADVAGRLGRLRDQGGDGSGFLPAPVA